MLKSLVPKKSLLIGVALVGVVILYALGADRESSGSEGTAGCQVKVNADILNVRAAPNLNAEIVGKFEQDAETEAQALVRNGFRKIADNRWAAERFLEPLEGANCGRS